MAYYCGIDVGSITTKGVLLQNGEISNFCILGSGSNYKKAAEKAIEHLLDKGGVDRSELLQVTATGCGAERVDSAHSRVGDLTCCAMGVHSLFPDTNFVIEVGGQATKILEINKKGKAINFVVSEKCAAGSGRFLQVIAKVLQIDISEAGELSLRSQNPVKFATNCAVFGESEAISRIVEGTKKEDIIAGVHRAIATKISSMSDRISIQPPCAMVGGGALDKGLVKQTEELLGISLDIPEEPQIINAYGAALSGKG
jgi:predicted CoA-substrate-specific enzyme activase